MLLSGVRATDPRANTAHSSLLYVYSIYHKYVFFFLTIPFTFRDMELSAQMSSGYCLMCSVDHSTADVTRANIF